MAGNNNGPEYELLIKLILTGDSAVGKTNLLTRFAHNEFHFDTKSTIGVEFGTKTFEVDDGKVVKVQIWDSAGQERYRALMSAYYRGAGGALLVYDITERSTFENISHWLREVRDHCSDDTVIMLVGNKRDLKSQREVSVQEAKEFCQLHKLFFIETSALNDNNVKIAFETLIKHIYQQTMNNNLQYKYSTRQQQGGGYGTNVNMQNNQNNGENGHEYSSSGKTVIIDIRDDRSNSSGSAKNEKKCCQ